MKQVFRIALTATLLAFPAYAEESFDPVPLWRETPEAVFEATDITADALKFQLRALVVFADTEHDPQYQTQLRFLAEDMQALSARDVIVITDADRASGTPLRQQLRPRGFSVVLLEKDGKIAMRKPAAWSLREITAQIDKSPLRRQEINQALGRE